LSKEKNESLPSIDETIAEIMSSLSNDLSNAKSRLDRFVVAFNKRFPEHRAEDRGGAVAVTWALMGSPLVLYALNLNGSVVIELHSILERFALRDAGEHIALPSKRALVSGILERCNLLDSAVILQKLGIFDKEDIKFAETLTALRNGLAHKNPKRISNILLSGKKISFLDIDSVMSKHYCVPLIIKTIHLMVKMSKAKYRKK
jgi:hypothetical protein